MKSLSIYLLLIFALSACKSIDKLYDTGDYEQVLSKLEGKAKRNNLDRREKSLLIKAANKYFETEQSKVLASSNSNNFKDWKNAKQKIKRLQKDADKISDYPQLRIGDVKTTKLEDLAISIDQKLFDYTMDLYDEDIAEYHLTGDRDYTIRASKLVNDLEDYGASDALMDSLYYKAVDLGHRFIAVDFDNDVFNSWEFRNNFKNEIDLRDDDFNTFTNRVGEETDYELIIAAEISDKDEDRNSTYQNYSEKVVDYYETEIDTASNNEIKSPVYKKIEARVKTVEYVWIVEGRGEYEIYDIVHNRRFDRGTFAARTQDRGFLYFLDGDKDAVPSNIDLETFSFPNYDYDDLIEDCFQELAEEFDNRINIKRKLK